MIQLYRSPLSESDAGEGWEATALECQEVLTHGVTEEEKIHEKRMKWIFIEHLPYYWIFFFTLTVTLKVRHSMIFFFLIAMRGKRIRTMWKWAQIAELVSWDSNSGLF